jgi:putative resolvase
MKLSQWAKKQGIAYLTAYRWFKTGKLPAAAIQLESGTILVEDPTPIVKPEEKVVIYCRVSTSSRKDQIQYQVERCETFCIANGWKIENTYKEIASGMNDNRKIFWKMINSNPTKIVVENKDRLTRFGFNYLEQFLRKQGCEIVVINTSASDEEDLMRDLVSIISSFCCRLYGLRRVKNKLKQIKELVHNND